MKPVNKRFNLTSRILFLFTLSGIAGLLIAGPLFANGQPEKDKLMQARHLIDEKKYDEANTLLAEIIKTEPEKFEQAQKLAREIITAQNTFNNIYADLIKAIDKGDVEKAVADIRQLNQIDPTPNETVAAALSEAKYSAELAVNLKIFNQIMTTAQTQLNQAQYLPAIQTYLSGFELHKEDFANGGYGNIVLDSVNKALNGIMETIERFRQLAPGFTTRLSDMENQIKDNNLAGFPANLNIFSEEYQIFKQLADGINDPLEVIKNQYEKLKELYRKNDDLTVNKSGKSGFFYLFYLDKLISGRREASRPEGIRNTMHLLAEESLHYLVDRIEQKARALRLDRDQAYRQEDRTVAGNYNQNVRVLYNALMQLVYLNAFDQIQRTAFTIKTEKELILKEGFPQLADYQEKLKEVATFDMLDELISSRLTGSLETRAGNSNYLPALNTTTSIAQEKMRLTVKLAGLIREWIGWRDKLRSLQSPAAADAQGMLTTLITDVTVCLKYFHQDSELVLQQLTRQITEEGQLLVNGETLKSNGLETGMLERTVKYPQKRVENLQGYKQYILALNDNIQKITQPWSLTRPDNLPERSALPAVLPRELLQPLVTAELTGTVELLHKLIEKGNNLLLDADNQLNLATQEMLEAERFKKEGQRYYNASQTVFRQRDYAKARSMLELASSAFDKALEKQEDPDTRNLRDKTFPDFIIRINQAENERVVGEVRVLLEQGIQRYRENRYEEAELLLLKAKTRWQDTNKNINEELEAWISVVQRARQLRKGWEITEVEPLYPEITQRLNLAIEDYKKGVEFKKEGSADPAKLSMENALEKLDNIKISYPLLKEANILRLKINKEVNTENFKSEFQKNMQETDVALKNRQTPLVQDKYSNLKEYELVLPGDKNLKDLLNEVEVYLGIRQRPPSQADIQLSYERVKPAMDIYNKRQRDLYPKAIELLNEAIRLWSDNKEAKQLKDKIQIARGEVVQSIITTDDQQALIKAEKLYSERNYAESYSITQNLLRKTANRNYPPLTALDEKNKIRLGIK